ncbi:MAG TPA: hypothetical protein VMV74_01630 [Bacteroidales bacterium]|nr:hypothetical protein [Bacteroidales bacterium]
MNKFTASDMLEVGNHLRDAGFDTTTSFIGDTISQIEKYWKVRKLLPSEEPIPQAVKEYTASQDGKSFSILLNDGTSYPINQQLFTMESAYNFLPERYRTFTPNLPRTQTNASENPI